MTGLKFIAKQTLKRLAAILFQVLLIATFALWFGGFTFYVSFVVPIGTDVLGSARTQGFVTQQVTHWMNVVCGAALVFMLIETTRAAGVPWKRGRWIAITMVMLIGGCLLALIWLHPVMDKMIRAVDESISDRAHFYQLHRIYLWLCTFQWIMAWIWLFVTVGRWRKEIDQNR